MALLDVLEPSTITTLEKRPRYRCAVYKEHPETGKMYVALSCDSACSNDFKKLKLVMKHTNSRDPITITIRSKHWRLSLSFVGPWAMNQVGRLDTGLFECFSRCVELFNWNFYYHHNYMILRVVLRCLKPK